jgi:mannose-6-phosphate isomerase-like protein (cupin superfamily)
MRAIGITFTLVALATAVVAQSPAMAPMNTFVSSSDVAAMIAKAKSERKADQPLFLQPLLQLAPYTANLEYRAVVGPAAVHEKEAELFYVVDGSGTMVTGGKLVNEKRTNAENLSGTGIEGGASRTVAKGDFIMVPEGTPHWFSAMDGAVVLMTIHVPRPVMH